MRKLASSLVLTAAVLALGAAPAHAQPDDGIIRVPTLVSLPVLEDLTGTSRGSDSGADYGLVDL
ncbi:hypothetical protein [Nocardiopsis halotolerans]|uniref:hypothetical protein n=1 Tax=Nocardiopsis halotolerans TaxID=124252 RepID=UPI00034B6AF1|nr:hypothetical protein [Nocardiopsis halotolerans]